MPLGAPPLGGAVRGRFTKWGGGRHWEWDGVYLGEDEHGHWWFSPAGTRCSRPGLDFVEEHGWVSFVPHVGAYAVGFYGEAKLVRVYVDMTTEPVWQPRDASDGGPAWEVTMVDLDLDVVLTRDGDLFVDDEDEFAEHQVALGYPPEVVRLAEATAESVLEAIASGAEPFGSVGHRRLADALGGGVGAPASPGGHGR